jgi:hypothetical protein
MKLKEESSFCSQKEESSPFLKSPGQTLSQPVLEMSFAKREALKES